MPHQAGRFVLNSHSLSGETCDRARPRGLKPAARRGDMLAIAHLVVVLGLAVACPVLAESAEPAGPLEFEVTFEKAIRAEPFTGRVLITSRTNRRGRTECAGIDAGPNVWRAPSRVGWRRMVSHPESVGNAGSG